MLLFSSVTLILMPLRTLGWNKHIIYEDLPVGVVKLRWEDEMVEIIVSGCPSVVQ